MMIVGAKKLSSCKNREYNDKKCSKSFPKDNDNVTILEKNCSLNKCLLVLTVVCIPYTSVINYVNSDKKIIIN
jgi:hypothetical protein